MVGGRACVTTRKASSVILLCECPRTLPDGVPARLCADGGEWYRYLALDGSLLDNGFGLGLETRNSDPREAGLRAGRGFLPMTRT